MAVKQRLIYCYGGCLTSFLLIILKLQLAKASKFGVEACKSTSTSLGCDIEEGQEIDWHLESNICKKGAKFSEVVNKYEDGEIKMKLCNVEDLDFSVMRKFAQNLIHKNMLPLQCTDHQSMTELGVGIILLKGGYPDVSVQHFNKVIEMKGDDVCAGLYFGRAMAYTKLGLIDADNAAHVLSDYTKALHESTEKESVKVYEARADIYTSLDRHAEAYDDYTEAMRIDPSYRFHLLRGINLVFLERYTEAYDDLQESLRAQPHQTIAMHYLAMCLFHLRRLKEAIKTFEALHMLKPMNTDIMLSLAQAYRESGDFSSSLKYFRKATIVQPNNAGLFHNKADLYYAHGNMPEALMAYRNCASLEPFNSACKFMKATCYASMGQFYPAIKELTKATSRRAVQTTQGHHDYPSTMYLREWCRYLHAHLDTDEHDYSIEDDINVGFKENWSRRSPFNLKNYTEQPGLQPQIKDISPPPWENQPRKTQKLLCFAYNIGKTIHLQGVRFDDDAMENIRAFTASGLATLEVSQTVVEFWKSRKSYRNKHGKNFSWKDIFEIAVKWIRFVEVDNEVFWMDNPRELTRPFVHRFGLIQGNVSKLRYEKYFPKFYKIFVEESLKSKAHARYNENLEPVENFQRFYNIEKKELDRVTGGSPLYIAAGSKVASKKDHPHKTLDGYSLILQADSERKLMLLMDLHLTWGRTEQFHGELEFIWQKIAEEYKKFSRSSTHGSESLVNLILSLSYYFLNLFPLARSSTIVSHSTALGLILALGKETSGTISPGKEIHLEALTTYDHEKFRNSIRSWLTFKKSPTSVLELENIAKKFPTFRRMLGVLQYDLSSLCTESA